MCNVAVVDFLISGTKIIIQTDGCFWHGCPEHNPKWIKRKENDKRQDGILTEAGYIVYRFWEHTINKSPSSCIDSINFMVQ